MVNCIAFPEGCDCCPDNIFHRCLKLLMDKNESDM